MLAGTPILVSTKRGEHNAGVRRAQDGSLWVAHWTDDRPERVAGTQLEDLRAAHIGVPGYSAVGARLAPGAVLVDVLGDDEDWHRAAVAQEAWIVFVPRELNAWGHPPAGVPPVRLLNDKGVIVSQVSPALAQTSRPLGPERAQLLRLGYCPVCGAQDWRVARVATGGGELVFCGACGHGGDGATQFWTAP